jgi:hypothetical protein
MGIALDSAELKKLISIGLQRGYVTHDDIRSHVPGCVQSPQLLDEIAQLMVTEVNVDVFESTPSEEERKQGPNARASADFRRGVNYLLPPDDD